LATLALIAFHSVMKGFTQRFLFASLSMPLVIKEKEAPANMQVG